MAQYVMDHLFVRVVCTNNGHRISVTSTREMPETVKLKNAILATRNVL